MADITMCNNQECYLADNCYRFTAPPDRYNQSYIMNPVEDCENDGYKYNIKVEE